jgi:PadR family transcriptional regulator, regulatory protein AphA
MPRTKTEITPAEYGILGLLRQKPAYGYELQRHFSGKQGLGRVCPVEPGMVYASLKSLSGLEMIDGRWDNTTYPPKAIYTTTDLGEMAFQRWLMAPVGRIREVRLDFMVKLYFALKEDKELAAQIIEAQLAATREYAEEIAAEQTAFTDDPSSFDSIVLGSKASAARITIDWLKKAQDGLTAEFASPRGS